MSALQKRKYNSYSKQIISGFVSLFDLNVYHLLAEIPVVSEHQFPVKIVRLKKKSAAAEGVGCASMQSLLAMLP